MPAALEAILNSHKNHQCFVMGVLNVTPDSFSDAGKFFDPCAGIEQARTMVSEGADIIDVGAESTRPGSERISPQEQIARLREVLPGLADLGAIVSIDTTRSEVAQFALDTGASIINDVSGGRDDPEMLPLAASYRAPIVLMHMLGQPKTMQADPTYKDVVGEVRQFLAERLEAAAGAGVPRDRCIVDPGIGFGKLLEHNLALLGGLGDLLALGCPVLIGPSRKRFIGELTGEDEPTRRVGGTIGACLMGYQKGASIFRVHDVGQVVAGLKVVRAIDSAISG